MADKDDIFKQEMFGVAPLPGSATHYNRDKIDETPGRAHRRESAQASDALSHSDLSLGEVPAMHSWDLLSFQRDGVQNGVFQRLRRGKYPIEARLDLHQNTVTQARTALLEFIKDCKDYDLRTTLIIHGRGQRDPEQIATLKSYLAQWLPNIEDVIAFHTAQKIHGDTGACYVMFRKTDAEKEKNRLRFKD